jgi:hypothetical protein
MSESLNHAVPIQQLLKAMLEYGGINLHITIANGLDSRNKRYALPAPPIPLTAYRRFASLSAQSGAFAPFSGRGDWFFGCLSIGRLVPILKSIDYTDGAPQIRIDGRLVPMKLPPTDTSIPEFILLRS